MNICTLVPACNSLPYHLHNIQLRKNVGQLVCFMLNYLTAQFTCDMTDGGIDWNSRD